MQTIGNGILIYLLTAKDYPKFAFVNEPLSFGPLELMVKLLNK